MHALLLNNKKLLKTIWKNLAYFGDFFYELAVLELFEWNDQKQIDAEVKDLIEQTLNNPRYTKGIQQKFLNNLMMFSMPTIIINGLN